MKCTVKHPMSLGLVLLILSGLVWGQALSAGQATRGLTKPSTEPSPDKQVITSTVKPHDGSFVIGNDDHLAINVWKEPDLSRSIPVRSDGRISLPLVGEIQAAGRTPLQLEHDIAEKLRAYMTDPEVTVMIEQVNSKKFNILGQVARPGSYSLELASTVMDAIALAGGFRDFAKRKQVYILRQNPNGSQSRLRFNYKDFIKGKNPTQNIKLEPHDTVIVP